ncbi:MAG: hypothetical protein ACM37W_28020 [Actinomycetota bacterium]
MKSAIPTRQVWFAAGGNYSVNIATVCQTGQFKANNRKILAGKRDS